MTVSLHGGEKWWKRILQEIDRCEVFVFLISNRSLQSKACEAELRYAIEQGKKLLPVMIHRNANLTNYDAIPFSPACVQEVQYVESLNLKRADEVSNAHLHPGAPI